MNIICSRFIGDFNIGDNINYNLHTLKVLYEAYDKIADHEKAYLRKPMIITIASVLEVLLFDLHLRITSHTIEGVDNIKEEIAKTIREKTIDDFSKFIDSAQKHHLVGDPVTGIYERLHELRKLRNRVHIQNEKRYGEKKEKKTFSADRLEEAEGILELTMQKFEQKYLRGHDKHFVTNFRLPWDPHFPDMISSKTVRKKRHSPRGWGGILGLSSR